MSYAKKTMQEAEKAREAATSAAAAADTRTGQYLNLSGETKNQSAVVFDAISEGPIEGLKYQGASIKLNGDRAYSLGSYTAKGISYSANASYNSTTGVITDHNSPGFMKDSKVSHGTRKMLIQGAAKNGTANTVAGNTTIIGTNIVFASSDVAEPSNLTPMLRIEGAGLDGADFSSHIVRHINTSAVEVAYAPSSNTTNATMTLDLIKTISSINTANNTVTVESPSGNDVNNGRVVMSTPTDTTNIIPSAKYDNFGWAFRNGHGSEEEGQTYIPTPAGVGSAGISYKVQSGELKQVPNTGYPSLSALGHTIDGATPTPTGSPVIVTASQMGVDNPGEVDTVKVTVKFSSLIVQKENGAKRETGSENRITFEYSRDGGNNYESTVVVGRATISSSTNLYSKRGGFYEYGNANGGLVKARSTQPFNYIYAFDVTRFQPFDDYRIKIERVSPDSAVKKDKWETSSASTVVAVENLITDKLIYPYTAIGGIIVDAAEFSSVPGRSYEIYGLKVKVPTNYFPMSEKIGDTGERRSAAAYTRNVTTGVDTSSYVDWDGNFRGDKKTFTDPTHVNYDTVYTSNPVWIFMDLVTNPRYGLGKYIDPEFDFSQIDKYSLYALAKYCDELVPDGKGGLEPRFTCNVYIAKQDNAIKVLKDFSSTIRSMLLWQNGQVGLGAMIQKGAVYTFSKSNVVDGQFAYSGSSNRTRCNQVKVTWIDPKKNYKQQVEVIEDTDQIAKDGKIKTKSVTAFGCTSKGQAIRYGKFHLLSSKLEQEVATFSTGLNGAMLRPGDVINIADGDREGVVTAGRVTSTSASTTTVIKTDRDLSVYLNQTAAYKLHLIYPKGGAYLAQPTATINSTTYYQGDLVLLDEAGGAVDTEAKAANVKDDTGSVVVLNWSEQGRIETQSVSSYNTTSVTVSSAFSEAPNSEVIFSISGENEEGSDLQGSLKTYMITSIKEDSDTMTYQINASDYSLDKFDTIDRGYVLEPEEVFEVPDSTIDVPVPTNLVVTIVPESTDTPDAEGVGKTQPFDVLAQWQHPKSQRTDSTTFTEGNGAIDADGELDDIYEHLSHYELSTNLGFKSIGQQGNLKLRSIPGDENSYTIENAMPVKIGRVRIRTVNTAGHKSDWVERRITISGKHIQVTDQGVNGGMNGSLMRGGILTTSMSIDSSNGTVTLASNDYVFQPPSEVDPVIISNGDSSTTTQAFNGMSDGDTAFLMIDYDTADKLRPLIVSQDTTATDADGNKLNFRYFKRVGQSGEDFTELSGTVTMAAESVELTGSSTTFETDFEAGDVVIIGEGADRHISTVGFVDSNTAMTITTSSTKSHSAEKIFKQAQDYDGARDSIIAQIDRTGSTYTLAPFTNKQVAEQGEIGANAITSVQIAANAIGSVEIATNSIGAVQISACSIDSSHISANSIGTTAISANAITSSEISSNSIDTINITANAITSSEISANAIGTVAIEANSITAAQLTSDAVGAFTVTANSITAVELAANSVEAVAIAANAITSIELSGNSVDSSEIKANSVNGTILAGNSVSGTQITAGSVNGIIIADNAVVGTKIAQNAVDTAQLLTGAVETLQIANNAINNAKIALNSVDTAEIISDAITGDLIAANAVDTAQIKANSITSAAIVAGAIGSSQIATNSIGTANIIAGTIDSSHISANSIENTAIVAGAIGTSEIATNSIGVAAIIAGTIDNTHMSANSITAAQIVAGEIDSTHIGANQITAAAILAGTITNNEIQANTINSVVVDSSGIEENNIAANAIVNAKIKTGAVTNASINSNASIDFAKINASNSITNADISAGTSIDFAKISVGNGDINNAMISAVGTDKLTGTINNAQIAAGSINNAQIAAGGITFAKITGVNVTTAQIAADAITNAKISSTDNMTITLTDGSAGGWNVNASDFSSTNASGGGNAAYTTAGIKLGAAGYISAKNFYIDTAGNAKFKGELAGATGTFSGSITVGAFNAVSGSSTLASSVSAAQSSASAAGVAANSAASAASAAQGTANNANTAAGVAQNSATSAGVAANSAAAAASTADGKAVTAQGTAANAATAASAAQSTADSKVTHAAVNSSSTIVGGGIGGWGITTYHLGGGAQANPSTRDFSIGTSTSGNATFLSNGGIVMGSDGFISSNTFTIDTAGNAKFKGTLEGDDVTVNGTLVLPSEGANVSGVVIGAWQTNTMDNRFVTEVGSGPGFYQGFVRVTGGTHYVKSVSIQIRTGTSTGLEGNLIYETPQLHEYTAGNLKDNNATRLYTNTSPVASGNMPIAFTYTGSGSVSVFVRAQADTGPDTLGIGEARFIKFGTTDPVYSFANQSGVALNTAFYSNTQVVGGFAGTKTVNISNTSFTRFKIDNGSFGTANSQIANGSYINVEITSSGVNLTQRSSIVSIGESSEVFAITTGGTTGGGDPGDGPGGGGCFVQGTPVVMADGTTKAIEDVNVGESVKSFRHSSFSTGENAWKTWSSSEIGSGSFGTSNVVALTDPHAHTNYYWINYNLKVTNEHPMLAFKDGVFKFVKVEDLAEGDYLIRENGTREEIFAIPHITTSCITHNMDVEDDDTYVVRGGNGTGYIAHNVQQEIKV